VSQQGWKPGWFLPVACLPTGSDKELRIVCYETEGTVFVEVKLWRKRGQWEGMRNSVRVALSQCPALIAALVKAQTVAQEKAGGGA
jgi:hypothetical protein